MKLQLNWQDPIPLKSGARQNLTSKASLTAPASTSLGGALAKASKPSTLARQ